MKWLENRTLLRFAIAGVIILAVAVGMGMGWIE